jgi:hypothetical protein
MYVYSNTHFINPNLRLRGHNTEGYGLSWSTFKNTFICLVVLMMLSFVVVNYFDCCLVCLFVGWFVFWLMFLLGTWRCCWWCGLAFEAWVFVWFCWWWSVFALYGIFEHRLLLSLFSIALLIQARCVVLLSNLYLK